MALHARGRMRMNDKEFSEHTAFVTYLFVLFVRVRVC